MIEAVLFDLDGTIINTEDMWADATKQMLLAREIEYTLELRKHIHDRVHGLPPLKACSIVKEMFNLPDSPQELAHEKAERARALFTGNIRLIDGFKDFYEKIQLSNFKTAVATNCDMRFVALADQEVNLSSFFSDHVYSIEHVENRSKPDPAIYLYAAKRLDLNPDKCIAIEDSAAGIKAAKNAGMFCIGINTAGNNDNLKEADVIVQSYSEIELSKYNY